MQLVGWAKTEFVGKDGTPVSGVSYYATYPLDSRKGGHGCGVEHFFMSSAKVAALDFIPALGDEIELLYSKYGKVQTVRKLFGDADVD